MLSPWPVVRFVAFVVLAALPALGLAADPTPAPAPPTDLEQIVRWHVAGVPEAEITRRIREAAFDLDLSNEMLEELRHAGLPESVIQALLERQRELHPVPSLAPLPSTPPGEVSIPLRGPDGGAPLVRLRRELAPEVRAELQLADGEVVVSGLAIYVACLTATHVPDHWRSESQLGRDFVSMPRHERQQLVLPEEPASSGGEEPGKVLEARFPDSVSVALAPDATHRLSVGLALRIGERYLRVVSAEWEGTPPPVPGVEVQGERDGSPLALRASFARGSDTP